MTAVPPTVPSDPAAAEARLRRAIDAHPASPDAYRELAAHLHGSARLDEAAAVLRALLRVEPNDADAHRSLAIVLHGLGQRDEAERTCRRAIELCPHDPDAHFTLGLLLHEQGRAHDAERAYRASLAIRPDSPDLHNNLGNVLKQLGQLADAEAAYKQALTLRPHYPDALGNLGSLLQSTGRLLEAELACRLAIALQPDSVEAHNSLGGALLALNRLAEAEASFRQSIALHPQHADAHFNLGIVLHRLERNAEAEAAYRETLRIRPHAVEALNNLGNVLQAAGRLREAADVYEQLLALRPDAAEPHHNLAAALRALGQPHDAEPHYRRALELNPQYVEAKFSLATLQLNLGAYEEGWRLYESRYTLPRFIHAKTKAVLPLPQWQGEALHGRRLLVWQEDGLGDMIQFGRYLPLLKAAGAERIGVVCMAPLHRLFEAVDGVDAVFSHDDAVTRTGDYDCWTSLLSVPFRVGTTLDTIPSADYLRINAARADVWRERLAMLQPELVGPRIGVVWKGNPRHHNDANRSLASLASLAPLWSVPGVSFVSLQKGHGEDEAHNPPAWQPLVALGHELTDFADTAAVIGELDLVICVDTSTAHLAASLGKPCWVLLPSHDPDWRWLHGRTDSPWYPQMRVFRQPRPGNWAAPVEAMRQACIERFAEARAIEPQ
ncbi:tetratricopeptide repeat protein [Paraburkholderia phosphatilytica]|uniref:tetratricopeptide repeat protein n=1 Tax=Paraburkholderia phosphatilytica TaxID=2282883 RepID=UPI000E47EE82|nr:tetratricopeptide repeat protein [Paraburkholderia phosphatilytica]